MKNVLIVVYLFVFAIACSDGGSSSGGPSTPSGCTSTSVSGLGLSPAEQSAAIVELNNTFNNYKLWDCSGSNSSALDNYGNNFGTDTGYDVVLGYSLNWWESGNEGWGYALDGAGGYIALWGSW